MKRQIKTTAPPRLWLQLALAGFFIAALLCFFLLRGNTAAMDALYTGICAPFHLFTGGLTGLVPFSVTEPFLLLFFLACLFFLGQSVWTIVRATEHRLRLLCAKTLSACVLCLAVYTGFSFLWGVCYYGTPTEQKLGLVAAPVSVGALTATTAHYVALVNTHAPTVSRNALMEMDSSRAAILASSHTLYNTIEAEYPFLKNSAGQKAKPLLFSQGMSYLSYTGIFFPFTGEANVNTQAPLCFFPATIAHELAHARGVGPEQSANLVAVLVCAKSTLPEYAYSGALLGYTHLSNALFHADPDAWRALSNTLSPLAIADLNYNTAYWQAYDTPTAQAANTVYEGFLQSYNQTLGLKSYGAVVDLLVAYHNA